MTISCVVGTYGSHTWRTMALRRAIPSTVSQGFIEVIDSHLSNGTLAQARNVGASAAIGEWLLFLDGDDELAPGFGKAMYGAVRDETARPALFTPAVRYGEAAPKIWPRMDFRLGNWCVIGTLIERDLFNRLGGFREYGMYEDWALWAMASEAGAQVFEVPKAIYLAHQGRRSRNRTPTAREKVYWHQRVGRDIWPANFDDLTPEEDEARMLSGTRLRMTV